VFVPEPPPLRSPRIVSAAKRQPGLSCLEPAKDHAHERLHHPPIGIGVRPAAIALAGCGQPRQPLDAQNKADQRARWSEHLWTAVVLMCGHRDTTGSAGWWPGQARLFRFMTTPQLARGRFRLDERKAAGARRNPPRRPDNKLVRCDSDETSFGKNFLIQRSSQP
jgi:hypothetical protein